jgi:hypothetical protein
VNDHLFQRGDVVRPRGEFLRSIQWITGVPVNGLVLTEDTTGRAVHVEWCDGNVFFILRSNLEPCPKALRALGPDGDRPVANMRDYLESKDD